MRARPRRTRPPVNLDERAGHPSSTSRGKSTPVNSALTVFSGAFWHIEPTGYRGRSSGSSVRAGSREVITTGISSCSDTSRTRPVERTRLSTITTSRARCGEDRPGFSSAGPESTGCAASGTGRAKTSASPSRQLKDRPEATQVRLELAYLYQELGDFSRARRQCELIIAADDSGLYARAARLNLANMDAESGAVEKARQQYDALILEDLTDSTARKSRALLELRLGQADRALIDLTALLDAKNELKNRHEVLAARALALLLLGRSTEAVTDAKEAQRLQPSPAHERLRQRALLAARQLESLQLDRPEDVLLPGGWKPFDSDFRAAVAALEKTIRCSA